MGKGTRFKKLRKQAVLDGKLPPKPHNGSTERFVWIDRDHPRFENYSELVDTWTGIVVFSMSTAPLSMESSDDHWSRSRKLHNEGIGVKQ
ncbi:MAG: hypothetical protein U0136_05475 [Bdellovibrionota bacterium]